MPPDIRSRNMNRGFYTQYLKRVLDLATVLLLAPLWLPLLVALAVVVRLMLGGPVFFRQDRPGRGGRPFGLRKFRTMTNRRDDRGELLPDEDRMTRFGTMLRATSLDELPELWNVLRGDMALIGPRPLLMKYLDLYTPVQARRHEVRPGLTGWAQVHGRNSVAWEDRFNLDVWYVDNHSFWLDFRILSKTVLQTLCYRDVSAEGHVTMPEFTGRTIAEEPGSVFADDSRHVWVLGAGGHAKVVIQTLREAGFRVRGIFDDYKAIWGKTVMGVAVIGGLDLLEHHLGELAIIAIGDGQTRLTLASRFKMNWVSVTHPSAWVDETVRVEPGAIVMAGAVVQPDSRIGAHVIINTGATVDHDCVVEDYVHLAPGVNLAGGVTVERGAMMGIGSCAVPGTKIGPWTTVGAGATVVKDLPRQVVAVGCPAKPIRAISELRRVS